MADAAEARAHQAATAEILRAISNSPTDVAPVFDAIANSAARLFRCTALVQLAQDDHLHLVASQAHDASVDVARFEALKALYPLSLRVPSISRRVIETRTLIEVLDTEAPELPEVQRETARRVGHRSVTHVPLIQKGEAVGTIILARKEPGLHLDQNQRALAQTFADQAVIAIENVRLFNETREALERQTATGEILSSISHSMADAQPVFDAIVGSLLGLFDSQFAAVFLKRGETIAIGAVAGDEKFVTVARGAYPLPLDDDGMIVARSLRRGEIERLCPIVGNPASPPKTEHVARSGGYDSIIVAPMLREGVAVGAIATARVKPLPFDDRQVELIKSFADQAVIAIENARLFNETKEALERQTATADILNVIASSPADVQPVFDAIATKALDLCAGDQGAVFTVDGGLIHIGSLKVMTAEGADALRAAFPMPLGRASASARAVLTRAVVHIDDVLEDPEYVIATLAKSGGWRSIVSVPMLREDRPIGTITVARRRVQPFSDAQIALLKTFASQAVIAIDNVRLFNETKDALERQTATAEILKVIASSPSDVQPVFDAIARSAARLFSCRAGIVIREGDLVDAKALATSNLDAARDREILGAIRALYPLPYDPERNPAARVIETRQPCEYDDTEAPGVPEISREAGRRGGFRSTVYVPLIREGVGIGAIAISFEQPGLRLNGDQRALLRTFADQAVIAIENVRLFNETKEALERQTATAEILKVISSSPTNTSPVFEAIVDACQRLFPGLQIGINLRGKDGGLYLAAVRSPRAEALRRFFDQAPSLKAGTRMKLRREVAHFPDVEVGDVPEEVKLIARLTENRSLVFAPLVLENKGIGSLWLCRVEAGPFTDKQIAMLKTFSDQASIAIQNARLFREIAEKSKQLEEASQHKSQFLASMSHELRTPLNAILGFNEMMLDGLCGEVPEGFADPLNEVQTSGKHLLRLINNVLDLAKIEAGRMELVLADYSVQDLVEGVRSTLRPLAAEKGLEFVVTVPEDVPLAHGDSGRLTQCLINLAGNSLKFTKVGKVDVSVEQRDDLLHFRVADTGIGIAPDKIGSLFTEFKQTDATIASEYGGSGLGLSIVKKFVEMHGGRIWVESELDKGSTFIFEIPLRAQASAT